MRDKFDLKELTNEIPLGEFLKYEEPVLVSRTNAVSGKLLLASEMSRFDTVGYDCAAVCINDMYAMGAKPLLFYDNISCARPKFEYIRDMEAGMENGCRQGNVTYAGSEIKELSDIFSYDQYDLVGFIAGVVEKKKKIGIAPVKAGDVIIGLPSNGLHNNGYVAARRKLYLTKTSMEIYYESLGSTLGDLLLAPTRMYRDAMEALLINMGFTVLAIADRMGHESIDITYRYAHLFPSEQIQMAEQLDIERMEKINGEESGQ